MQDTDPEKFLTEAMVEEAAETGLALGLSILAAEAEAVATMLGLGSAALARSSHPKTPQEAAQEDAAVESGFDNMPV